jgi:EmrB/QacA subfamily drug resistance transporter
MRRVRARVRENLVPLIVATALFMQHLDSTAISTSLPAIAADFETSPINLKLAVTTYLLALAVFIPASGWVADRYGAKNVFRLAMVVFALGSIGCGLSQGLGSLVAARVVQGIGGAMMVPVGRLVVLRTVPKQDLIGALAWLTIPALFGPIMGPPVGGFLTTYFDWRWIFWVNVPVAALGVMLITRFIPNIKAEEQQPFDLTGFFLIGPGISLFLTGATVAGLGLVGQTTVAALIAVGAVLIVAYVAYALRAAAPIIDLTLLSLPTFRAGVIGGLLFRIGIGAMPFLLPLLLQSGFGMTAFQSGLITFAGGIGSLFMKPIAPPILNRFGFRSILVANAVLSSALLMVPALFTAATPVALITIILLTSGFTRSLQFTSINALVYADVPSERLSRATSFTAMLQELSGSIGVAIAAFGLELMHGVYGGSVVDPGHFPPVFIGIACLAMASALLYWHLPIDAGRSLLTPRITPKSEMVTVEVPPPASHV